MYPTPRHIQPGIGCLRTQRAAVSGPSRLPAYPPHSGAKPPGYTPRLLKRTSISFLSRVHPASRPARAFTPGVSSPSRAACVPTTFRRGINPRLRMWWSQSTIIIRRDHVLNHKFTIADNHMINKQSNNFLLE
jgi:hypothetical protein